MKKSTQIISKNKPKFGKFRLPTEFKRSTTIILSLKNMSIEGKSEIDILPFIEQDKQTLHSFLKKSKKSVSLYLLWLLKSSVLLSLLFISSLVALFSLSLAISLVSIFTIILLLRKKLSKSIFLGYLSTLTSLIRKTEDKLLLAAISCTYEECEGEFKLPKLDLKITKLYRKCSTTNKLPTSIIKITKEDDLKLKLKGILLVRNINSQKSIKVKTQQKRVRFVEIPFIVQDRNQQQITMDETPELDSTTSFIKFKEEEQKDDSTKDTVSPTPVEDALPSYISIQEAQVGRSEPSPKNNNQLQLNDLSLRNLQLLADSSKDSRFGIIEQWKRKWNGCETIKRKNSDPSWNRFTI